MSWGFWIAARTGWRTPGRNLGRNEYEDALKTYRELAQKNPESYLPDVAQILSNMGLVDYSQNRMEQGGEEFRRALKIYRELAQRNPGTYQPAIAQMLHNLGLLDSAQRRTEQARQEYEEALKIRRELAQKNPETYLPDVAMTLNNLGFLDYSQKRMEEARQEYEEALKIRRQLAQKNPETYLPDVAMTLNNLGFLDYSQKRMEEARQESEETLKTYRELAQRNPDSYLPEMAQMLHNLGLLDSAQRRTEQARQEYEEALKIRRELAQKNPETYLPDVAMTLNNLGGLDSAQKRIGQARQEYREALKIYRELAQKHPEIYLTYVATTLNNMGLPISAGGLVLLQYLPSWPLLLFMAGVPFAMLAVVRLFGWRFRRSLSSSMQKLEGDSRVSTAESATAQATTVGSRLVLHRLEVRDVEPATGRDVAAISETQATRRASRFAYTVAAVAYSVVATFAISTALAVADPHFPADLLVVFIYLMQCVPLFILLWSLGISIPVRLAIFAGYLLLGLFVASLDSRAAILVGVSLPITVLLPMGLLLLLARPLRPLLFGLVAILLYFLVVAVPLYFALFGLRTRIDWTPGRRWAAAGGFVFAVLGVVLLGWILRRRRWR